MFTNADGIQVFEPRDLVKIGKRGTVDYKVTLTGSAGTMVEIEHPKTGRRQDVAVDRLVLVENSRTSETWESEAKAEDRDEYLKARSLAFGHLAKAEDEVRLPMSDASTYSKVILGALQGVALYLGTVSPRVKAKRRARGKVAKASRKANRK